MELVVCFISECIRLLVVGLIGSLKITRTSRTVKTLEVLGEAAASVEVWVMAQVWVSGLQSALELVSGWQLPWRCTWSWRWCWCYAAA